MGIFDFFKIKKDIIQIDFDISTEPVYVYPSKKIKLPTTAIIQPDMEIFFCDGGKVLDGFSQGEHAINLSSIPNCDKKFKLSKPNKDGRLAKFFYCNIYFVNKNLFKYKTWKTYRKAYCYDEKVGEFSVGLSGAYAFKIIDSKRFVTMLLKEYDTIKNKEAEKILSGYVGDYVLSYIEKNQVSLDGFLNKDKLVDKMYEDINNSLDFLGVQFLGFNIERVNLPKHLRLTEENIIYQTELEEKAEKVKQKHGKKQQNAVVEENVLLSEKNKKNDDLNQDLEQNKSKQVLQNNQDELLHFANNKNDQPKSQQTQLANTQSSTQLKTNVRCLFCGFENKPGDTNCSICGHTLKRKGKVL